MTARVLVAEFGCVLPAALLVYLRARGRVLPAAYWLVAWGFLVSLAADIVAELTDGSWIAVPWYQIVQYGLFAAAMFKEGARAVLPSVLCYVLVGGFFRYGMMQYATLEQADQFMPWWYGYQGARIASFGLFGWSAWRFRWK